MKEEVTNSLKFFLNYLILEKPPSDYIIGTMSYHERKRIRERYERQKLEEEAERKRIQGDKETQ